MTDKELLEIAARAAGYKTKGLASRHIAQGVSSHALLIENDRGGDSVFDPLTDDGDALRLAVKLDLYIRFNRKHVDVSMYVHGLGDIRETFTTRKQEATRRAITRAAAEIGRAL